MKRRPAAVRDRCRAAAHRAVTVLRAPALADWLLMAGAVAAMSGAAPLVGWPVTRLVFGLLAMLGGVAIVVFQARSR